MERELFVATSRLHGKTSLTPTLIHSIQYEIMGMEHWGNPHPILLYAFIKKPLLYLQSCNVDMATNIINVTSKLQEDYTKLLLPIYMYM